MSKSYVIDDIGYVELYDKMGNDLRIVNNARQSFGEESQVLGDKEKGLIKFLMRERHGTPFEAVTFQFNVKCPIFVMREWIRHRIGSFNEYSGRYTQMTNEFYVPQYVRTQTGKPGSYKFEPVDESVAKWARSEIQASCGNAYILYNEMLKSGVAKEIARIILPLNVYTQFTWTVNLRSLFNFVALRSHETAMWEIRQYSLMVEGLLQTVTPVAYEAFVYNGRKAP